MGNPKQQKRNCVKTKFKDCKLERNTNDFILDYSFRDIIKKKTKLETNSKDCKSEINFQKIFCRQFRDIIKMDNLETDFKDCKLNMILLAALVTVFTNFDCDFFHRIVKSGTIL